MNRNQLTLIWLFVIIMLVTFTITYIVMHNAAASDQFEDNIRIVVGGP